jgi:GAF domain-containing protein
MTEQREALEQRTATAEVLQVINASPGNLAPVFDVMLDKALGLCDAAFGVLWTHDGERGHAVALRGAPPAFAEYLRRTPHPIGSGGVHARLLAGEAIVHIEDIAQDQAYRSEGNPVRRALVELGGGRTLLAVPLRTDNAYLGHFVIYRREVRTFSNKQIALLQNFADQAVIAMENARLLTEQREALEQQTATAEVLQVINASPGNLTPVFDAMLERATTLCHASFGILWDFDGEFARAGALHQVPEAYAELVRGPFRPSPGSGPARIMRGEGTFAIAKLTEYTPYQMGDALTRALVEFAGARSVVITPLRKDTVTLGAITLYRQEVRPFSNKQIALLENFAAQAVIAMENARLLTEQREALEQQTATAEVLQVINASPGNLAPVFQVVLEKALRLCGASFGTLSTYDGEHIERVAFLGVPPAFIEYSQRNPLTKNSALIAQGIATRKPVQAADIMTDARMATSPSVRDALIELGGVRALLQVPLLKDGAVIGFIGVWRRELGVFPDKQVSLVEGFAAQAVIAMENARLLTNSGRRWSSRPRRPRCCRSSTPRRVISRRYSTRCWKRHCGYVRPPSALC